MTTPLDPLAVLSEEQKARLILADAFYERKLRTEGATGATLVIQDLRDIIDALQRALAEREGQLADLKFREESNLWTKLGAAEAKLRAAHTAKTKAEESELATAQELDEVNAKLRALRDGLREDAESYRIGLGDNARTQTLLEVALKLDAILIRSTTAPKRNPADCTCAYVHRSSHSCPSKAFSRGAIPDATTPGSEEGNG